MPYRPSDQAPLLISLLVDVDRVVATALDSMKAEARGFAMNHNAAIDLLTGLGNFESAWADDTIPEDVAARADPAVDSITIEAKSRQSPYARWDAAMVKDRVQRLAVEGRSLIHPDQDGKHPPCLSGGKAASPHFFFRPFLPGFAVPVARFFE